MSRSESKALQRNHTQMQGNGSREKAGQSWGLGQSVWARASRAAVLRFGAYATSSMARMVSLRTVSFSIRSVRTS
jgi:hypothetical protein